MSVKSFLSFDVLIEEVLNISRKARGNTDGVLLHLPSLREGQEEQAETPDVSLLTASRGNHVFAEVHAWLFEDVLLTDVRQAFGQAVVHQPDVALGI